MGITYYKVHQDDPEEYGDQQLNYGDIIRMVTPENVMSEFALYVYRPGPWSPVTQYETVTWEVLNGEARKTFFSSKNSFQEEWEEYYEPLASNGNVTYLEVKENVTDKSGGIVLAQGQIIREDDVDAEFEYDYEIADDLRSARRGDWRRLSESAVDALFGDDGSSLTTYDEEEFKALLTCEDGSREARLL